MTSIFASWTLGAALLFSAVKNMSLIQLIKGEPGAGEPSSIVDATFARSGGGTKTEGLEPVTGKGVKPKGSVKGHSELKPGISAVAATVLKKFPGLSITSTTGGNHVSGSYHYKGRAVDIGGSSEEMFKAAKWIGKNLTHVLAEGIHNPNLAVKDHRTVSSSTFSEVWAAHANHIHLAV